MRRRLLRGGTALGAVAGGDFSLRSFVVSGQVLSCCTTCLPPVPVHQQNQKNVGHGATAPRHGNDGGRKQPNKAKSSTAHPTAQAQARKQQQQTETKSRNRNKTAKHNNSHSHSERVGTACRSCLLDSTQSQPPRPHSSSSMRPPRPGSTSKEEGRCG